MSFTAAEIENLIAEKIFVLTLKRVAGVNDELIKSGILSSIAVAELALTLEETFGIKISFVEVNRDNFASIASVRSLVLQKL